MPKGVPVATVAIGNAANAGLLALRILAGSDAGLQQKMLEYQVCSCVQVNPNLIWHMQQAHSAQVGLCRCSNAAVMHIPHTGLYGV